MVNLARVVSHAALGGALLFAFACGDRFSGQAADPEPLVGGNAGSSLTAGGGGSPSGGASGQASKVAFGGVGDTPDDTQSAGTTSGTSTNSVAGSGGTGGTGGSGDGGSGGAGGEPEPEPVTVVITEFEDTYVVACTPELAFGNEALLLIDTDECAHEALVRPSLSQLPHGALVVAATLTFNCVNIGGSVTLLPVTSSWAESTATWNNKPKLGEVIATFTVDALGPVELDVKDAVSGWLRGEAAHGLAFRTTSTDGTDLASSEAINLASRPKLTVTYVPTK